MLFILKRSGATAFIALVVLLSLSLWFRGLLGIQWQWQWPLNARFIIHTLSWIGIGAVLLLGGFLLIQSLLYLLFGSRYVLAFQEFSNFSRQNGPLAVLTSALLAAIGEELFFRGIVLHTLLFVYPVEPGLAVATATLASAAVYLIMRPSISLFTLWAVWEAAFLGVLYVLTDSLIVVASVHAISDLIIGTASLKRQSTSANQSLVYRVP